MFFNVCWFGVRWLSTFADLVLADFKHLLIRYLLIWHSLIQHSLFDVRWLDVRWLYPIDLPWAEMGAWIICLKLRWETGWPDSSSGDWPDYVHACSRPGGWPLTAHMSLLSDLLLWKDGSWDWRSLVFFFCLTTNFLHSKAFLQTEEIIAPFSFTLIPRSAQLHRVPIVAVSKLHISVILYGQFEIL